MSRLSSIASASLQKVLGNRCYTKAVLARDADAATKLQTTNAATYSVGGVLYSKSALNDQAATVTHRFNGDAVTTADPAYVQPSNTKVKYVVALDAAGNVAVVQGSYAGQTIAFKADLSKVLTGTGDFPAEPAGYTAIGYFTVETNASATFTPGTTALNAAGVTATFFDVAVLPA